MKKNPGRKQRRQFERLALTKGHGSHSPFAGTHRKKKNKHKNSN